jgi:Domain of unknown function (DUF4375)
MTKSLSKLLVDANDSELCIGVAHLIHKRYGDQPDIKEMHEPERVFFVAWCAYGLVSNGGFNYLFEGIGGRDLSLAAKAFETIGCEPAAGAFRRAFALFPNGVPEDQGERLHIYRSGTGEERHEIDMQFMGASKQIDAALVAYIRRHAEDFKKLEKSKPAPKRRKRQRLATEHRGTDPVAVGIADLPRWARVAFAARCARMVFPFFHEFWPDAIQEHVDGVNEAIIQAAKAAAIAQATPEVKQAEGMAGLAAGTALSISLYGYPNEDSEPGPPDGNAASSACQVIKAAEHAAAAAGADNKESCVRDATQSYAYARGMALDMAPELFDQMARDFRSLQRAARRGHWTDRTPVPQSVFTSTDDDDEPPRPWWKFW